MSRDEIEKLRASRDEAYERVAAAEHRAVRLAAELEAERARWEDSEAAYHEASQVADALALQVTGLRTALNGALECITNAQRYGRFPQSCGACGTPNAACDTDCVAASYIARDISAWRKVLASYHIDLTHVDEMQQQRDRLRSSVNHHAMEGCEQCRVLLDELEEEKRG